MRDAQTLESDFQSGRLIQPNENELNIVDLANSLALLSGVDSVQNTHSVRAITDMVGETQHLIFVVVDGFGETLLNSLGTRSFLAQHKKLSLRTVFPTTTASAITSFFTGEWPNRHAAIGWYTYLPEANTVATIVPFVRSADQVDLTEIGLTLDQVYPTPSILSRYKRNKISLLPYYICGSGFSTYCSGGGVQKSYRDLNEAVDFIVERIKGSNLQTYTYLYISDVDSMGHKFGYTSDRTLVAARHVDQLLSNLYINLKEPVRIIVSSDHGGLDAPPQNTHYIAESGPITKLLRNDPSGDSRVGYFHVKPGAEVEFEAIFKEFYGPNFYLISVDESESLGIFGPGKLTDMARARIGTFVSLSKGIDVLLYDAPSRGSSSKRLIGHHSGLSPAEIFVPLIVI